MPSLSRDTLPQEFYDITSDMLLVQPEPQYLHGQLMKAALGASLAQVSDLGLPFRMLGGSGAGYGSAEDGRLALEQRAIAGEAVLFVPELGKMPGHTVRLNRPSFTNSTYTQASRLVPSGTTISTTPISVSSEQTSITIQRFAGPYSSGVAPLGLGKFDATMPIHKLAAIAGKHLTRDFDRWIDAVGVSLYDAASVTVRPDGFSADTDGLVAGDMPMDMNLLFKVEKSLDTANIPMFSNGKRICVLHPQQILQLKQDSAFQRMGVFTQPKNPLWTSHVATVGNLDIYQSNTLNTASSTTTIYRGQAFGPGMVGAGVSRLPEVLASTSDNYGEDLMVVWLCYMGFQTLDNRFGVLVSTN
jgi:hypothetical protein